MGIFGDQVERLLRESWPNATMLAEELYAIFNSTQPLQLAGPLTVTNPGPGPGITVINDGPSNQALAFMHQGIPAPGPTSPPGFGPYNPGNQGPQQWTIMFDNGAPQTQLPVDYQTYFEGGPVQPLPYPPEQQQGGGSTVVFLQFVSGGPGQGPYKVKAYPFGLGGLPVTQIPAFQLQIADDATIPPGTWALGVLDAGTKLGRLYRTCVPVWLSDGSS